MKTTINFSKKNNLFGYRQILFFIFCVININAMAVYQMQNWTLPPNKVFMDNNSTPTSSSMPSAPTTPYKAANGVYDENNSLLFYVIDGIVYNSTGGALTSLPGGFNTSLKEVVLSPVEGQCKTYYVIIAVQEISTIGLYSCIIDASGASPSLISGWSKFAGQGGAGMWTCT